VVHVDGIVWRRKPDTAPTAAHDDEYYSELDSDFRCSF
jgi:hypothetical protein